MTLGSWAIVSEQTLLGLIPLVLYIILAMKMKNGMIMPLVISIAVGCIMSGNGAISFGRSLVGSLGGLMGQVGLIVLMGAGLGGVMNKLGVTATLCRYIIKAFRVNSSTRAIWVITAVVFLLSFAVGSGTTAAAINIIFLIPIAAKFRIRPITMTTIQLLAGFAGMTLSPFSATNIAAMEITGLTFPEYLRWAAGPYVIVTFACSIILCFWVHKKFQKVEEGEFYELLEEKPDEEVDPVVKRATLAFIIFFIACIAFMIIFRGGLAFTFFYLGVGVFVMALFGKHSVYDALDTFFASASRLLALFFNLVLLQVLLDTIGAMGGFEALGAFCSGFIGDSSSQGVLMFIATMFGVFGINGAAAAQMVVINDVFAPMVAAIGLPPAMWSMALLMGSLPSNFLYPGTTQWGILGICNCSDFKTTMKVCWITVAVQLVVAIAYCFIVPAIF